MKPLPIHYYLGDSADSFGTPLTKNQPLVYVQVLWSLDEAEVDSGFIPSAQAVFVHAKDSGCLANATTMY